jgi:hypothetical protein
MNTRSHLGVNFSLGDLDGAIKKRNSPKTRPNVLDAVGGK